MITKTMPETTVAYLGDSITKGYALDDPERQRFSRLICENHGFVEKNFGITGTLMAAAGMNRGEDSRLCFTERLQNPAVYDNDILVIFGGTNDYFWTDTPIYPAKDTIRPGVEYFSVAIDEMCRFIVKNRDKNATLLVTPYPHRGIGNYEGGATYNTANEHETNCKNYVGHILKDYSDCIVAVGERYGIPVLNLQETAGFSYATMTIDGCHPNPEGHAWLAHIIGAEIAKLAERHRQTEAD